MCVRFRNVDEIIKGSVLYILAGFIQLEVHYFGCIGHTRSDKYKGHMDIVKEIFEHCLWVYVHG